MQTAVCFYSSVAILLAGLALATYLTIEPYKRRRVLSPLNCVLACVFFAAFMLFLPIHLAQFLGEAFRSVKSILVSIHSTMRLFVLDGEFDIIREFTAGLPQSIGPGYSLVSAILYVLAPGMTFSFVLSFFKNVSAYRRLMIHHFSDIYVFSELNERALALAASLEKPPHCLIVFTDVFDNNEESVFELCERAKELGAICFRKDIVDINWGFHSASSKVSLFAIGEDETENIDQSVNLIACYGDRANFRLFIFASRAESEVLFHTARSDGMRIRRINPFRSLISQNLYQNGYSLFREAIDMGQGRKKISAVLLGIGQYGVEMLRALPWFCQMDGYDVTIHAFDKDPNAEENFTAQCPELMAPEKNGIYTAGEAQYRICIYSGVDVETKQFMDKIHEIGQISYVFVALGDDSDNIQAAIHMRMLCGRENLCPTIQAIVYNSKKKSALERITDYRGHAYQIDFFGDLETAYSEEVIIDSELERIALERHLKWGREEEFWAYEHNYQASVAAAIHRKMRILCGIRGAEKKEEELTDTERDTIMQLEHRRWNAYMRSEGYIFSGSTEKSSRNDLAKMHHDLVPFYMLNDGEKRKDSHVGTK